MPLSPRALKAGAVLTLLLAPAACGRMDRSVRTPESPRGGRPSLLLITIDTWRWDHIGVSGSGKAATPHLDRLAREGVYEPEAETPYPLTTPAHASLLTGTLPLRHGLLGVISYRLAEVPTLAEAFRSAGYRTAAFVSSATLDRRFGLDRGFEIYDQGSNAEGRDGVGEAPERDGSDTTRAALAHLRTLPADASVFLWIHYFDLHRPYRPRPHYDARYPESPYAAQVAFVDDEVGKVRDALRADGGRSWRIIVVGDHGEGFGDHHEATHGLTLYRSTLHVPLLIHPRPERPLAHARPWRLEDLDPTVREWFGLPVHAADGESLFRSAGAGRWLPSLTVQPSAYFGVNPCLGMRRDGFMYIRHGVEELFDLAADPDERHDLSGDPVCRRIVGEMRRACAAAFPPDRLQAAASATVREHPSELKHLRSLGYLGGFVPELGTLQRADLRQVCDDEAAFMAAREAFARDRDAGAMRRAYEALLGRYPKAPLLQREFGDFLLRMNDHAAAARAFENAVRLNPQDTMSMGNLAGLELLAGRLERAQALFEGVLAMDPDDPVAHRGLGILFSQHLGKPAQAVEHFRRYLELVPPEHDTGAIRAYIAQQEGRP